MTAKQLRASILQLAVQGKLVPQDPADEPASELLARIRAEKARLVKEGKLKKEKNPSEIFVGSDGRTYEKFTDGTTKDISSEIPFDLPRGWAWARLGSSAECSLGKMLDKARNLGELHDYFRNVNVQWGRFVFDDVKQMRFHKKELDSFSLHPGDIVMCEGGEPGRCAIWRDSDKTIMIQKALHRIRLHGRLISEFFVLVFEAYAVSHILNKYFTGTTIKHFPLVALQKLPIPIPPIAEQKRIVEKIEELLPRLDEYDKAQKAAASYESAFPDAFRKSVLQAAVQGKLVPQSFADEPAEKMLARLLANTDGPAKKRAKGKATPSRIFRGSDKRTYETRDGETICIDDEVPFDIPDNWAWVRASSLGTLVRGNGIKRNEATQHGVPCIRYGELYTTYRIRIESVVSRTSAVVAAKAQPVEKNDILLTLTGENKEEIGMADAFLADEPAVAGGDLCVWHGHGQNPLYLAYALMSPFLVKQKAEASNGDIIVHLSAKSASDLLLPLPPIAEQGRIVAEIERLLALGDRLRETS